MIDYAKKCSKCGKYVRKELNRYWPKCVCKEPKC